MSNFLLTGRPGLTNEGIVLGSSYVAVWLFLRIFSREECGGGSKGVWCCLTTVVFLCPSLSWSGSAEAAFGLGGLCREF